MKRVSLYGRSMPSVCHFDYELLPFSSKTKDSDRRWSGLALYDCCNDEGGMSLTNAMNYVVKYFKEKLEFEPHYIIYRDSDNMWTQIRLVPDSKWCDFEFIPLPENIREDREMAVEYLHNLCRNDVQLMTFRTEIDHDNQFVPDLLDMLGVKLHSEQEVHDWQSEDYKMGMYTIEVPNHFSLEQFRKLMEHIISTHRERFADMHRCYQTLALGTNCQEYWYLDELDNYGSDR